MESVYYGVLLKFLIKFYLKLYIHNRLFMHYASRQT
jgi:hypothetical protein